MYLGRTFVLCLARHGGRCEEALNVAEGVKCLCCCLDTRNMNELAMSWRVLGCCGGFRDITEGFAMLRRASICECHKGRHLDTRNMNLRCRRGFRDVAEGFDL